MYISYILYIYILYIYRQIDRQTDSVIFISYVAEIAQVLTNR